MNQTSTNSQDWRADYLLLAALWGSSFLFMRMGASEFGPLATAWGRVFVATLFLGPLMLFKGHWKVFLQNWKLVLGLGSFNSALPFALFAYANTWMWLAGGALLVLLLCLIQTISSFQTRLLHLEQYGKTVVQNDLNSVSAHINQANQLSRASRPNHKRNPREDGR